MKNMIRLIGLVVACSLFGTSYAATVNKIQGDVLKVVPTTSGANPTVELDTGFIRKNKATNKIEFSHDGTNPKNIGSGSGSGGSGGVDLLVNSSFEDYSSGAFPGWTVSSGATLTQVAFTNGTEDDKYFARFTATASGQYVDSDLVVFPDAVTGACLAYVGKYKTYDNNIFSLKIQDDSNNDISSVLIASSNGVWTPGDVSPALIPMPCPSSGVEYKLRFLSNAEGVLDIGKMYFGSENRLVRTTCQGRVDCEFVFSAQIAGAGAVSGENLDFINGNCADAGSGVRNCTYITQMSLSSPMNCVATVSSDVNGGTNRVISSTTSGFSIRTVIDNVSNNSNPFNVVCVKQGLDYGKAKPETALSQFQSSWIIDANIGGGNISLSTGVSSYTEVTNASLDIVINSNKKSAPAKIPCSSTNPAGYPSCSSGSEGVGVVFNPPYSGLFKVCAEFEASSTHSGASSMAQYYQLVETANNSQTILQEGNSRTGAGWSNDTAGSTVRSTQIRTCGNFIFGDTSEKTIRLMYESAGTASAININADRSSTQGQRDIHITVEPILSGNPRPVLTGDTLTTPGAKEPTLCSANISATGVISNHDGGCFSSCTNATTPVCDFVSGYYPSGYIPKCWTDTASYLGDINGDSLTSSSYSGAIRNSTGTAVSGARIYFCHGRRK